jgi:hypothetical protein
MAAGDTALLVPLAMLTGARPFSGPSLPFCLPVIATRLIAPSIGLAGFAVAHSLIRAPLDRFQVGFMAEIPVRENLKNTKTSKTSQISLGPRENLLGRADLVL